jgi:hypothetical protein
METPREYYPNSPSQEPTSPHNNLEPQAKWFLDNKETFYRLFSSQEWLVLKEALLYLEGKCRRTLERSHLVHEIHKAQGGIELIKRVLELNDYIRELDKRYRESVGEPPIRKEIFSDEVVKSAL